MKVIKQTVKDPYGGRVFSRESVNPVGFAVLSWNGFTSGNPRCEWCLNRDIAERERDHAIASGARSAGIFNVTTHRSPEDLAGELKSALADMMQEFRSYDLPYGSAAYARASALLSEAG